MRKCSRVLLVLPPSSGFVLRGVEALPLFGVVRGRRALGWSFRASLSRNFPTSMGSIRTSTPETSEDIALDKPGTGSGGSRGTLSSPGIDVATAPFTALGPMLITESPELTLRLSILSRWNRCEAQASWRAWTCIHRNDVK